VRRVLNHQTNKSSATA